MRVKLGDLAGNPLSFPAGTETMGTWDLALLAVFGYLAVMTLVRLMIRWRNNLLERLLEEAEREQSMEAARAETEQEEQTSRAA